ncbi:MAG: gamma-glutamyl-gamma-aminobutyrate hydrolase family protein [Acidobacteria bacterium]|nr:gamma-glutamyl-gamma-aminobutyrate hydrolase family protein [Acidobacteriota bacterium]
MGGRPRAGITYRYPAKLEAYAKAVEYSGFEAVPLLPPGPVSLDGLDALLISGGTDLSPALYGQPPHPATDSHPDGERDEMECRLLRAALDADLPLLCICRGLQLLNVAYGGDLIQHLPNTDGHRQAGVADVHVVRGVAGSAFAGIMGEQPFTVNSRHHQAVGRIGAGLVVSAWAEDGVVEGMELPGKRFAVAVQWHPEDRVPSHEADTRLFAAFRRAAER